MRSFFSQLKMMFLKLERTRMSSTNWQPRTAIPVGFSSAMTVSVCPILDLILPSSPENRTEPLPWPNCHGVMNATTDYVYISNRHDLEVKQR